MRLKPLNLTCLKPFVERIFRKISEVKHIRTNKPQNRICPTFVLTLPSLHRLQEDAEQDEGDTEIEGEIDFATFAKDEEGKNDGVTRFEIVCQINGKGREAFQSLDLQEIHANGAE